MDVCISILWLQLRQFRAFVDGWDRIADVDEPNWRQILPGCCQENKYTRCTRVSCLEVGCFLSRFPSSLHYFLTYFILLFLQHYTTVSYKVSVWPLICQSRRLCTQFTRYALTEQRGIRRSNASTSRLRRAVCSCLRMCEFVCVCVSLLVNNISLFLSSKLISMVSAQARVFTFSLSVSLPLSAYSSSLHCCSWFVLSRSKPTLRRRRLLSHLRPMFEI